MNYYCNLPLRRTFDLTTVALIVGITPLGFVCKALRGAERCGEAAGSQGLLEKTRFFQGARRARQPPSKFGPGSNVLSVGRGGA